MQHLYFLRAGNHTNSIQQPGNMVDLLLQLRKLRARLGYEGNVYRIQDHCPVGSPYKPVFLPEPGVPSALVKIHFNQLPGLPKHGGIAHPPKGQPRPNTRKRVLKLIVESS